MIDTMTTTAVLEAALGIVEEARKASRHIENGVSELCLLPDGGSLVIDWSRLESWYLTPKGHYSRLDNLRVILSTSATGRPASSYRR